MRRAASILTAILTAVLIAGPASSAGATVHLASPQRARAAAVEAATGRTGADRPAGGALPTVSGGFGETPTISFPSSGPPTTLVSHVLDPGKGPVVRSGELIAVNYTGQIWKGKVFDSTFLARFNHQTPFAVEIGVGDVVPGWDDGIPGARVGSRMLLVLPPKWGYGGAGAPKAGISGTDTLVFVVDILATWGKDATAGGGGHEVTDHHGGVTVTGSIDEQPQIHVAGSAPKPKTESQTLLERGAGPAITDGLVVYEETVANWSGKVVESTWQESCPTDQTFTSTTQPSNPLAGIPIGSRLLIEDPKSSDGGPYAFVIDIVADLASP